MNNSTDQVTKRLLKVFFHGRREEHKWVQSTIENNERKKKKRVEWEGLWPWAEKQEQKVHRWWNVKVDLEEESVMRLSVTGSGSTEVCCLSARQWLVGHLCPLRCCLEIRRAQICPLSASVTRYGRFLQREIQEKDSLHFTVYVAVLKLYIPICRKTRSAVSCQNGKIISLLYSFNVSYQFSDRVVNCSKL